MAIADDRRRAVAALIVAGAAWGTSVPFSKAALGWLAPGWLAVVRFGLAAAVLLVVCARSGRLRECLTLPVLASGRSATTVRSPCRTSASPAPASPTRR